MAPPLINEHTAKGQAKYRGAGQKSQELIPLLAQLASEKKLHFFAASSLVEPDPADGYHLSAAAHQQIANHLATLIANW